MRIFSILFVMIVGGFAMADNSVNMPAVVPLPQKMMVLDGCFTMDLKTVLTASSQAALPVAQFARQELMTPTGFTLPVVSQMPQDRKAIVFELDSALKDLLGDEGYRLIVKPDKVRLTAAAPAGLFYAFQTFRQLLPAAIYADRPQRGVVWSAPCVEIEDKPRFGWRGLHLDVSRHFMPVATVKKYLDVMAVHKLNRFHWHLTDDQGWRLEIRRYPRLTEIGAWRKETLVGRYDRNNPNRIFDGIPHGGYYTQDDVRQIVAYAKQRFITVVPEIDMPAHTQAAIAAYPQLGISGKPVEVLTYWGGCIEIVNIQPETIQFFQNVLEEVLELFDSPYIHIGGDEADRTLWENDPATQARMKELGIADAAGLQSWFIHQMDEFLTRRGRRLVGWDEILDGGLAPGAVVMSWRGEAGGIAAANAGHDVIMTPGKPTYFDHYQADPTAEPLAIRGCNPLDAVYGYEPIPADIAPEKRRHVLGAQGQLWTEYIPTPEHLEYMAYPRACALAEVVWTEPQRKDWQDFTRRLKTHLTRLDALGVNYRKPKEILD